MSIYLRNTIWWIEFIAPDGTRIRRSAATEDRQQALELEAKLKHDLWRVYHLGEKPRMLWKEAVVRFMREKQNKDSSNEISISKSLDPYFGHLYVDEIRRMHIDDIIQQRLNEGVSNATVNRLLQKLRAVLNIAHKEWEVKCEPLYIKLLKEPKKRVRWLTESEAQRLIMALSPHLADMVIFSLETGLRESNVTLLRWNQVDLSQRIVYIEGDDILKSERAFVVPLSDSAVDVIKRQVGKHPTNVFTYKGKPIKRAHTKSFNKALVQVGIENFRWHDLRHTWATWHVQRGTPLEVLQELGGWSDYKMVKRYAHFTHQHLQQYVNRSPSDVPTIYPTKVNYGQ